MGRREAREAAVALVYCLAYHPENMTEQVDCFLADDDIQQFKSNEVKYIREIAEGVIEKLNEIDPLIERYSKGWSFNRIPGIDIAVLRLSIYEIFYREDIPSNVSINEAVDIAKRYGHDESGTFVNGILGSIYRNAVAEGTLREER